MKKTDVNNYLKFCAAKEYIKYLAIIKENTINKCKLTLKYIYYFLCEGQQ